MKEVLAIVLCVIVVIVLIAIGMFRTHNILGHRAQMIRYKQNLSSKYNKNVVRGKDGRFKSKNIYNSVQSPHIKKA